MKHTFIVSPMFREFSMFGDIKKFKTEVINKNHVFIDVNYETNKSLHVSIVIKNWQYGLNLEGSLYKTLCRRGYSFTLSEPFHSYHFKLTAYQGIFELKKYVEENLKELLGIDNKDFQCYWYKTPVIKKLLTN